MSCVAVLKDLLFQLSRVIEAELPLEDVRIRVASGLEKEAFAALCKRDEARLSDIRQRLEGTVAAGRARDDESIDAHSRVEIDDDEGATRGLTSAGSYLEVSYRAAGHNTG